MFVDNITLLVREGYREAEIMEMTLDKLDLCTKSINRRIGRARTIMVVDTAAAVAGIFGKKGSLTEYIDALKDTYHG